ncbi:hypothetical protein RB195_002480 [Necator americanus]|uniref:Proteasome activator complex subunit 4 n=1 Tax=Necator americanus TaxID=51031 RepID=A0ABR1DJ80_NECAM
MASTYVVVDSAAAIKRDINRKFGRHEKHFVLVPYHEELTCELDARFDHIKHGLITAVLVNEQRPGLRNFVFALKTFLSIYGFRFSKEEHVQLIQLFYLILVRKDQWPDIVNYAAKTLEDLVNRSYFNYDDITLDWEPLYNLYYDANYGKLEEIDGKNLRNAVFRLKRFYRPSETPKIWDKIQVHLSPRYSTKEFCDLALLFLPIRMTTEEHKKFGAGLWFETVWKMYEVVEMGNKWGEELPNLFATLAYTNPDFMDWSPLYDVLFTRAIRAMGLSIRESKVIVGDAGSALSLGGIARMIVATLGGPYGCQRHLERMMQLVEPFMHPSNESSHTLLVLVFLQNVLQETVNRYREERTKSHKRKVPKEFYLTDSDIEKFTDAILQSLLYSLYTKDATTTKAPARLVMILGSLCPGRVFPRFFEHAYPAIFAVDEPHRLTQTLDCLFEVVFLIARDSNPEIKRLKMEKDWVREMEEQRSPTSPIAQYSLEKLKMLIEGIDINDVAKANIAIHNLTLIFFIVPILDYSGCIDYHDDLTDEEKALCKISVRLPVLAEMALDKMLGIVESLAVTAPKDSSSVIGSFCDAATTKEGSEEKILKKAIDRCVAAIFKNANDVITAKLGRKVLDFVRTNQFECSLATDMIASMVAFMTYELPSFWVLFAEHVLHKLKIVLTPEMRNAQELDASASWFVSLAASLLGTTSENYIQHKQICFEMIDLLVNCRSKVAYNSGALGLFNSLYTLSRTYPENTYRRNKDLSRPLKEWVPIREWGRLYKLEDVKMAWNVPSEKCRAVMEEILRKFLFPVMDLIKHVHVDRETLKKSFTIMSSILTGGGTCFSLPPSPLVACPISALPWFNANIPNTAVFTSEIRHPSGKNIREMLTDLIEKIINRSETSKHDLSQVLVTICSMLHYLIHINYIDSSELLSATETQTEIFTYMTDPVNKSYPIYVLESMAYVCHMKHATVTSTLLSNFHLRVIRLLIRLSLNDYAEVRMTAQTELHLVFAEYTVAREAVIDDFIHLLVNDKASKEKVKGALDVISKSKLATNSSVPARIKIWRSLLEMKSLDVRGILDVYEGISKQIGSMQKPMMKHYSCKNLTAFCETMFTKLQKAGEWSKFNCENSLEMTRNMQKQKRIESKKEREELVAMLLEHMSSKDLTHSRMKLCRTMLWRCQMEKSGIETIKILLSKIADEEKHFRDQSAEELCYWLKAHKPRTIRMKWPCPKKQKDDVPLKCGIRPDNLCLVYDSKHLPKTEEKWNTTVFVSKQYGCYKWPPFISVVVFAKRPQLNRTKLSDCEKAIVEAFENAEMYKKWISLLLIEKRDLPEVSESTVWIVKYLLRNFPDSTIIYKQITRTLMELLKSRKRAEQRLAAEFFAGVAMGTKYRGFKELNELWTWLAPAVDLMYDFLNADAHFAWHACLTTVLHRNDSRRYWWLIEQLLKGMARPAPTAWHQAVRSVSLPATSWRETETCRRICEIAWRNLPKARIETQRIGISNAFKNISAILDANMNNNFKGLPKRFQIESIDFWLQRFEGNLGETASNKSGAASAQTSETKVNVQGLESKNISMSEVAQKLAKASAPITPPVDVAQIYLRTLLEFLLQYYEDGMTCLTSGIISLLPVLLEYANEEDAQVVGSYKDMDIKYSASLLIHDHMSNLLLTSKFADLFLNTVLQSYYTSYVWRVKVSVLKFVQVLVFSNVYELERGDRAHKVARLLFDAVVDRQMEVRTEASRCMLTLILCNYIKVDKELTNYLDEMMKSKNISTLHGAIVGMGAVVRAHPYSTPPEVKPILKALCGVTSHNAELQNAATSALREFRRTHRENWEKTAKILGSELVYKIENAIAPVYYA